MAKRVRVRHAGGSSTIKVPSGGTAGDAAGLIESIAPDLTASRQVWKAGYPPRPLPTMRQSDPFPGDIDAIHASLAGTDTAPTVDFDDSDGNNDVGKDDDEGVLASALAASYFDVDGPEPPLADPDGVVVRRVIDSDNSCLFNSVGYCLRRSRSDAPSLRRMAARAVRDDPVTFTEAFLGQDPAGYTAFLLRPDSWGGQIELHIFSTLFRTEIAAYDIVRDRSDVYGTGRGYRRRAYVLYDGIHYDALAHAFDPSLPEEADVTLFSPTDEGVAAKARALCEEQHRRKEYTDTSGFALRCGVCQVGLRGAADAQDHAQKTGHTNFSEY
eukprot:CAMPEP_0183292824 /NCGR_PEP_ID=MMETSP0160_2-20130417/1743_1 /TAXON_ID=2839 ORGANISM="Odontella Sinensis, Strain Grunow 1884" /NCGR_SAMPLE_ID=MMETSP0160_2 /ASSEMBLY_ACC=CAM_ASM_000250 /LENGTH=326 /DNA_ID=CAMNT_0025453841 /DNA_START=87 /DNA_END=1067 /DNA_ORIENTATION=+